ncbi:four helix bundle protein [Nibrella viscosa]|uniref:Four helix bundle protein n=1 Tax=Nibrella viscosa TaxID=1084524 RepID=A0ABP8KQD2_9BACT
MKVVRFEDLIAWQKAQDLASLIYEKFYGSREYGFKDQIFRASVSVSNNIAEGFERNTDTDFARFLHISKGSDAEVKSMLYLAKRLKFIGNNDFTDGLALCNEIGKILNALINSIKR